MKDWTEVKTRDGLIRWAISTGGGPEDSARVVIGHDSGPEGALGIWGHNSLGPTVWHFDGCCVHTPARARVLGEALLRVLCRRETAPALAWDDGKPWGHFTGLKRTRVGDFGLMVDSASTVITNDRYVDGGWCGGEPNEERVDCWGWWVSIRSEDDARSLWRMKSWTAIRDVRVAMSYAERVQAAFAAEGFGRAEVLRGMGSTDG